MKPLSRCPRPSQRPDGHQTGHESCASKKQCSFNGIGIRTSDLVPRQSVLLPNASSAPLYPEQLSVRVSHQRSRCRWRWAKTTAPPIGIDLPRIEKTARSFSWGLFLIRNGQAVSSLFDRCSSIHGVTLILTSVGTSYVRNPSLGPN